MAHLYMLKKFWHDKERFWVTFDYRQLIEKKNWNSFFSEITHKKISKENGYFIPVLAPQNISQIQTVLGQCIDCFNEALPLRNCLILENIDFT